jgi:hypothetical protein
MPEMEVAVKRRARLLTLIVLVLPIQAQATLLEFGATGGGPSLADVNAIAPGGSTTLRLVYSTIGSDDPFGACTVGPGCIFGWTAGVSTTGTLQITDYDPTANPNTASGAGATTCDPSLLPSTSCSTVGGDAFAGESGTNIAMFSVTVSGGTPGDQLEWAGDFTLSDFSSLSRNQVIATVLPEPRSSTLTICGLLGWALLRDRRRPSRYS